jgi:M6 family metalloprotease-like protein
LEKTALFGYLFIALLTLSIVSICSTRSFSLDETTAEALGRTGQNPSSLRPDLSMNTTKLSDDFRFVVILVEFTDIKHRTPRDEIHGMVFETMHAYWQEVSYGQFNVTGDTVGWIDLGQREAYYGKDIDSNDPGSDLGDRKLLVDACRLAEGVDFTQYQDIIVVYAGHGQDTDSKNTDLLWPSAYLSELDVTCGRKTFDRGGLTSEFATNSNLAIGPFAHEFGHTIGLLDLYDTSPNAPNYWRTGIDYVGSWSLMADGEWAGPGHDGSSPIGLESWSRIKLGWLSSVSMPLTPAGLAVTLNEIANDTGPRALKLAWTGDIYYLVEVREKTGADMYLPDSGVLITRIDESRGSGNGIVEVMDCHPQTKSIDDATCKLNESWSDKTANIFVKVIEKRGGSYVVAFANKPITTLNVYTAEVSLVGLPSSRSTVVRVDDVEYASVRGNEKFIFIFPVGSTHTVTISQYIFPSEDVRYYAEHNTITITGQGAYIIEYLKQHRLVVYTPAERTEKWLTPDQTVTLGPYDEIIGVDSGTRSSLVALIVDGAMKETGSIALSMNQPHLVELRYVTQYYLRIDSSFGDPKGQGWYNASDVIEYSVTTPYGFLVQHIFVSWAGDITSTEPQGTLTITRPYTIRANWRDDYAQLILLLIVLAVLVVAAALKTVNRRKPENASMAESGLLLRTHNKITGSNLVARTK